MSAPTTYTLAVEMDQRDYDELRALARQEHERRSNGGAGGMLRMFCSCGMPHSGLGSVLCDMVGHVRSVPEASDDAR